MISYKSQYNTYYTKKKIFPTAQRNLEITKKGTKKPKL